MKRDIKAWIYSKIEHLKTISKEYDTIKRKKNILKIYFHKNQRRTCAFCMSAIKKNLSSRNRTCDLSVRIVRGTQCQRNIHA